MSPLATRPPEHDHDLLDPAFYLGDPHGAYRWMRANEPVYRDTTNGLWAVTRHADIRDVESRADVFVSSQGYRSFFSPDETNMIAQDDPGHSSSATSCRAGSRRGPSVSRRTGSEAPCANWSTPSSTTASSTWWTGSPPRSPAG